MSGTLVLCGAPIGDVRDASPRLGEILATADVIAAEDTRRVLRLAHALGITITGRVVSCYDQVEGARAAMLTGQLLQGATVALITDAGMPAVSDPGFRVVAAAAAAGITVTVVPGPSAVTAALAVSGLPSDRWTFEGFLPRRGGERRGRLRELRDETRTMVFLESPHRIEASLRDLAAVFGGPRPAVLCRELTKTFEEIVRGDLAALVAWATDGRVIRGEFTLVVGGGAGRGPVTVTFGSAAAASAGGVPGPGPAARGGVGVDPAVEAALAGLAGLGGAEVPGAQAAGGVDGVDGVDGADGASTVSAEVLAAEVARRAATGMSRKDARRAVAADHGVSRNDVYAAELAARPARPARPARTRP
ncbi:16S rRNA (cytidine(1402)-2'-O)-methyltransferase [Frankia sp. AgKG'84/4]|uniref:16S rRNA (cytidine(1402)-2'-O)-methyltransferase n=1 Tax=Frankia sp. AgKG'84/4 TaxID=573490 RepID=UPI00200D1F3E|nr:16S rRNA (cytidine(1402)-2'-O)-methyltransferase [Frankia sp. AgKG'84/4]MCL9795012.1 16S rRNA (cytidine(1402)-2'-O)-methyltransferase [Frankia sp. AgKG'84/4]